jgi:hypothetical protein
MFGRDYKFKKILWPQSLKGKDTDERNLTLILDNRI